MHSISSDGTDTNIIFKTYYVSDILLCASHVLSNFSIYLILSSEHSATQIDSNNFKELGSKGNFLKFMELLSGKSDSKVYFFHLISWIL